MDNRFSNADSQIAKLTQERDEALGNFAAAQRDAQYLNTALQKGLNIEQAQQLQGNTPEELNASADALKAQALAETSGFDGGVSPGANYHQTPQPESPDNALRAAAGY